MSANSIVLNASSNSGGGGNDDEHDNDADNNYGYLNDEEREDIHDDNLVGDLAADEEVNASIDIVNVNNEKLPCDSDQQIEASVTNFVPTDGYERYSILHIVSIFLRIISWIVHQTQLFCALRNETLAIFLLGCHSPKKIGPLFINTVLLS